MVRLEMCLRLLYVKLFVKEANVYVRTVRCKHLEMHLSRTVDASCICFRFFFFLYFAFPSDRCRRHHLLSFVGVFLFWLSYFSGQFTRSHFTVQAHMQA